MTVSTAEDERVETRPASPLRRRDFRLMWAGQAVSSLGDQFALVALPWLALVLTGSALALGGVLAVMAVPRAALMLVGGVYVDRLSPRRVMLLSNAVRLVAVTGLALIVLASDVSLPMVYLFALVFGVADAFFFPAQQAIIPALVEPDQIPAANAIAQGTTQLTVFAGPAVAGLLVAALGSTGSHPGLTGIGTALLVDALSFVVSIVTLVLIRAGATPMADQDPVVQALKAGLTFVWRWPSLRFVVLFAMGINFFDVGPLYVGLPMIAYSRLPEGAAAYGTLMSALGGGSLLGMVAVATLPRPRPEIFGSFVLALVAMMGIGVAAMALVSTTLVACLVAGLVGVVMGYANLTIISWAQQRIPRALMGRVFSLILLGSVALIPVSQVLAGALVQLSLSGMLLGAGVLTTLLALGVAATRDVRAIGLEPILSE